MTPPSHAPSTEGRLLAERAIQLHQAPLHEVGHRHRGHRLDRAVHPEHGVGVHRPAQPVFAESEVEDGVTADGDEDLSAAGEQALVDLSLEPLDRLRKGGHRVSVQRAVR